MSREVTTRTRFTFLWHAVTQELTAAGAWTVLVLAASDASGTGYQTIGTLSPMIESLSTFFNRYRIHSVSAKWCGSASSTTTECNVIKFVPEAITSAAESSDWYNYVEGTCEEWHLPYQTTVSHLKVRSKDLSRTGLLWKDCNSAVDDMGAWGSLVFLTGHSTAEAVRIVVEVDMEFAELTDPDISLMMRGLRGVPTPSQLVAFKARLVGRQLDPIVLVEEPEDGAPPSARAQPSAALVRAPVPKTCLPTRRFK